jgi:hypothetical protein
MSIFPISHGTNLYSKQFRVKTWLDLNPLDRIGRHNTPVPWGRLRVSKMDQVLKIRLTEAVRVDHDRLGALYADLGEAGAEDIVCRAMEELALRLSHCKRLHAAEQTLELRKYARSLIAIADQIGMHVLSRVAGDVIICIDAQDKAATAATFSRLLRVGEQSLTAIWDLQDITI